MNNSQDNLPLVVICGRTNVGKSTLFNRLVEKKQALVSSIEGTTRDANIGLVHWNGKLFRLVDTAGLLDAKLIGKQKIKESDIDTLSQKQALNYLNQAQLLLFVVDGKAGLMPEDREIAKAIRKHPEYHQKTLLITNKIDGSKLRAEAAAFNRLGLGEPCSVSAQTGSGTGDMLETVIHLIESVKDETGRTEPVSEVRLCIVGKPNVGKSSLLNSLLGYDRAIVSDQAHTTRESQDTEIQYENRLIRIIDTAGISRQGHKSKGLEKEGIASNNKKL